MVCFVNKKGEEVEADFPLHPTLINVTRADGASEQYFRDDFDAEFVQKIPALPAIDPTLIPPYEPPTVTPVGGPLRITRPDGAREPLPTSHASWYALIYDELVTIERKLDGVIAVLKETPAAPAETPQQDAG